MVNKSAQEGVILIFNEVGEPIAMVRKNGHVVYYKLEEFGYQDHAEFLGADVVVNPKYENN